MPNEFATPQPTTQDSETILWKKLSDWLYVRAVSQGADNLVEPNDSQNVTLLIRAAAYNAYALSHGSLNPQDLQGQTQWIKSLAYSLYSLASGGDGTEDPNTLQGETPWIRSLSYSLYSLCVSSGVIAELIDPHASQGETWWVRSAAFSMYALATGIPPTDPPVNTISPALSNTSPRVGQTVTCSTGSWIAAASFTRQWFRDGVAIGGQTTNSHVVVTADIGKVLKCEITAHNIIGATTASSNNTNAILSNDTSLSVFTVEGQNVVDGGSLALDDTYIGDVIGDLTIVATPTNGGATVGTKTVTPSTMIVGANTLAFNVTAADGVTTHHYTVTLNVSQVPAPVNTVAPALDNTSPGVGDTISCDTGTWTNSPTSYTYQWFRDASSIGGATSSSYLVDAADIGAVLTCKVTAHNAGGASSPATSNATDPIPSQGVLIYSGGTVNPAGWTAVPNTLVYDGHDVYADPATTSLSLSGGLDLDGDQDVTGLTGIQTVNVNSNPLNSFDAHGRTTLTSLSALTADSANITGCSGLTSVTVQGITASSLSLSGCTGITSFVTVADCPGITSQDFSPCSNATSISAVNCPLLTAVTLTGLSSVTALEVRNCALAASPDFSDCVVLTTLDFSVNALTEAAVDAALAGLVAIGTNNGTCDLSGGTNAIPSAAGLADKATLEGDGWTVTVNSAPFVPTDITGCELWLDASQIGGLSDGDPVSTWSDGSGNGNDAVQATGGSQPTYKTGIINSLPVVRFATSQYMIAPGADFGHFFAVVQGGGNFNVLCGVTGSGTAIGAIFTGNWVNFIGTPVIEITRVNGVATTVHSPTDPETVSGSIASPYSIGANSWAIGSQGDQGRYWVADIAEVIFYAAELSNGDRDTVEAYLIAKWNT